jgi:hypothetical protein
MLYREGKRLAKEDLQGHIEILKETFPSFFRKQGAYQFFTHTQSIECVL